MGPGGGGQVISVRPFYSDDPSSNHAEVNSFFLEVNCLKRRPIKNTISSTTKMADS